MCLIKILNSNKPERNQGGISYLSGFQLYEHLLFNDTLSNNVMIHIN